MGISGILANDPGSGRLSLARSTNHDIQVPALLLGVCTVALGWLFLRSIFNFANPEMGADSLLVQGSEVLGTAGICWLIILVPLVGLLGLMYWATFVPVVMAPPKEHRVVSKEEADELLKPGAWVLGLDLKGKVRAYPRDLIARPHWFNDEIDGKPLMVSYCILCNTGQAFIPVLKNGQRLDLRNMTAFDNNTVYHDTVSGNFIQQLEGRVIRGPNAGEELESYPVVMAKWDEWKAPHPETDLYYAPPLSLRDKVTQKMLETMIPLERLAGHGISSVAVWIRACPPCHSFSVSRSVMRHAPIPWTP